MGDTYYTVSRYAGTEIPKIKGSRFIGEVWPVHSADEAERHLESVRKREHAASHHCYAYRLGPEASQVRFSDAGEPSGTAGRPILRQLESRDLTDVLVVVTRYFGGTKLGTGGLSRAYGAAAASALDQVEIEERVLRTLVRVRFDYADTSAALRVAARFDAISVESRYGARTDLTVAVPRSQAGAFRDAFLDELAGRGEASRLDPPSDAGAD